MARLAAVFPALSLQPEFYYELLNDLSEDYFAWSVMKLCKEQKELFPNTNIVALLRNRETEFFMEKIKRKPEKQIEYKEPEYDSEATKKAREDFIKLRDELASKKGIDADF